MAASQSAVARVVGVEALWLRQDINSVMGNQSRGRSLVQAIRSDAAAMAVLRESRVVVVVVVRRA